MASYGGCPFWDLPKTGFRVEGLAQDSIRKPRFSKWPVCKREYLRGFLFIFVVINGLGYGTEKCKDIETDTRIIRGK